MSAANSLTDLDQRFLQPQNSTHRLYEALRAYFVDKLPSREAARRFGYTPASFRVLVHRFRQQPERAFFLAPARGPHAAPKKDQARELVISLRKQNLSIYDISRALAREGLSFSPVSVAQLLREEGFARLPRRDDGQRPAGTRPTIRRRRRCSRTRFATPPVPYSVRRPVLVFAHAGPVALRAHPPQRRFARFAVDPRRLRHPLSVGPQTVRLGTSQPRHEFRAR